MNAENRIQPAVPRGLRIEVDEIDHLVAEEQYRVLNLAELLCQAANLNRNLSEAELLDMLEGLCRFTFPRRADRPADWLVHRGGSHVALIDRTTTGDHRRALLAGVCRAYAEEGIDIVLATPLDPSGRELLASPVAGLRKGGAA